MHGDDAANNAKLLAKLEGVEDAARTARFVSSIAFIEPDGLVTMGEGACEGVVGHAERGTHGFGYDPLFLPDDTPGKTMAELAPEEKNAISHRFHALEDLCAKLSARRDASALANEGVAAPVEDAERATSQAATPKEGVR